MNLKFAARRSLALGLIALGLTVGSGCTQMTGVATGPDLGILGVPIPVSPYFQDKQEDRFWEHERYKRVPVLGPVTSGGPPVALDEPSDDEVMRAMERAHVTEGGVPLFSETQRNNVRITKELIADYVDPPRVYPLVGPAQLHHAHYKCTIYYSETRWVGWPLPYSVTDEDAREVIYIDHNHLHRVECADTENLPRGS